MENPLISIIIPVYKTEKYLDRCVESVVNQTYKNLEIILVDDGSPDKCPAMCDAWTEKDNRIKTYHIENKGVANARNFALGVATGDYIGFVDSDDYIEPNMYQFLLNAVLENDAEITVCGYQINDEADVDVNLRTVSQFDALKEVCVGDYKYGVLWNKLYKKKVLKGVEMPPLVCCEDLVYNYYAFKNAKNIVECDSKLYHYFQNDDSTVHGNFSYGAFDAIISKRIIFENEQSSNLREYAIKGIVSSCFIVLSGCIQNNAFHEDMQKLIDFIVSHKKEILKSNLYSKKDKIKIIILWIFPSFYKYIVKQK
ncbi:MAG: glycosyltransferase family 2 protein [Eubacteriales bacterium]|nr:glycosyltransferase family 2 protein [Eubacteriales bacterium]